MFCGLIIGGAFWLVSLIEIDSPILIENPGLVAGLGVGIIVVMLLSTCGILYCYALLVQVIVKHVSYDTLKNELDDLLKRK